MKTLKISELSDEQLEMIVGGKWTFYSGNLFYDIGRNARDWWEGC